MSDTMLEKLSSFDACAVSDAMDALDLPAAISGMRRQSGNTVLAGRVQTVTLTAGLPAPDAPKVHLCATAIDSAGSGSVIVISHPGIDAGGWGGVLSFAAKARGVEGVIMNGPTRDVDEARELGFPIYATATTARTARGRLYESATGHAITIAGVHVHNGDYAIADDSGVVFIPAGKVAEVLYKAADIVARERSMTDTLAAGSSVVTVLDSSYEDMLKPLST